MIHQISILYTLTLIHVYFYSFLTCLSKVKCHNYLSFSSDCVDLHVVHSDLLFAIQLQLLQILAILEYLTDSPSVLANLHLPSLSSRRRKIIETFFNHMKHPSHRLKFLIPNSRTHNTRSNRVYMYVVPSCKTDVLETVLSPGAYIIMYRTLDFIFVYTVI